MFQIGNQVLVANNILRRLRDESVENALEKRGGKILDCENGNVYRFPSEENAKGFYRELNSLVCNTKDPFEPRSGFQY